ncbi:MAG: putative helix-destabilizing protein [Prokaryotic dsDNA virus sp.]|nr:MAG: putative helix-destabilizing protein [Prokaryotic dsDNA virus sp.]|tara:strand:- start:6530 stop:7159 length:630 start_codon:yes stop_codon:yes gene_type:complete
MATSEQFKTPECRLSFAQDLFKPRQDKKDDGSIVEKFGCTLIFSQDAMSVLEAAVVEAVQAEWGDKGIQKIKDKLIKSPFLAGTGKEARNNQTGDLHPGMGEGLFFIRPWSKFQPVIRYKSETIPATAEEVYSGCYGFAVLHAFTWHNSKNGDGVSFGIDYFQKKRDGDRLGNAGGGAVDPSKFFEKVEDHGAAPDATKSGAGAGGLFA